VNTTMKLEFHKRRFLTSRATVSVPKVATVLRRGSVRGKGYDFKGVICCQRIFIFISVRMQTCCVDTPVYACLSNVCLSLPVFDFIQLLFKHFRESFW
jgi:hypothetical protein